MNFFWNSSLELHHNEEFFTETETEWQIEEAGAMERSNSELKETLDQAARIMPEMSDESHILTRDQVRSRFLKV